MPDIETEGRTTVVHTTTTNTYPHELVIIHRLVYFVLDVVEGLLALRFILLFAGANPFTGFVNFIYSLTEPLVSPFRGIFPLASTGLGVIDWGTLIAMIVYALLVWIILRLVRLVASA